MMIYISKPHGTHAVFEEKKKLFIARLLPGWGYQSGPQQWSILGERKAPSEAFEYADKCDENRIEPVKPK